MSSPKVLVVEDDLHTRNIIEMVLKRDRMLRYHQLQVICAGDGEEGLALFKEHLPDILITDLLMPKMDGFELVKAVRASETKGNLPILATSAIVRDKSVLRQLERNYDVLLQLKPFSPKVFASQVRKLLQALGRDAVTPAEPPPPPVSSGGSGQAAERVVDRGERHRAEEALNVPPALESRGRASSLAVQSLRGDLAERPLARLLLDAFEGQWSGTLEVRRQTVEKRIYLLSGYPIFVRSNLRNETLGQLLVRRGGLTEAQHQDVIRAAQRSNLRYGEALVRLKLLTEQEVMAELVAQTRYKVQSCLRWRDGSWTFEEDAEIGGKVPRCTVEPLELVFNGLRRHHSVEEASSLLRGGKGRLTHIVRLPAFEQYGEAFAESFGFDLIELIGTGCPLRKLAEEKGKQDLAVQLDVMLQTGMVELCERSGEPNLIDSGASSSTPLGSDIMSLGSLAEPTSAAALPGPTLGRHKSPKRRIEAPEVRMARQLIEATYLGLHGKTHYEVLSIIPETDDAGIEVAYRVKRKQFDLGRFRDMDLGLTYGHLEEICAALDSAHHVLGNPERRRQYNDELKQRDADVRDRAMRAEDLYRAGCGFLEQKRHEEALRALGQAVKLDDQAEYRVQEALAYFLVQGRTPEAGAQAMQRVRAALQGDPQQPRAHLVAARIAIELGSVDEAVEHLREAMRVDPTFEEAFNALERLLLDEGQLLRLEEEYRRAIFTVGNRDAHWAATLWRRLSHFYRDRLSDARRARIAAEAALKLDPYDSDLRLALADADGRDPNRWPDAVRGYRSVMLQEPTNRSAVHKIFHLHAGAGRTDAAFLAASVAMVRGCADGEELRLVDVHGRSVVPRGEGRLSPDVFDRIVHPKEDRVLSELFARLSPLMLRLHPVTAEQRGAAPDAKDAPTPPAAFDEMLYYLCRRLGVDRPPLRLMDDEGVRCRLSGTADPELLVSLDALLVDDERELCFRLAQVLYPLQTSALVARVGTAELLQDYLFATIALLDRDRDLPPQNARVSQIQRELERESDLLHGCGKFVAQLGERVGTPDPVQWLAATSRAADRLGLLLCGDVIVSVRALGDDPEARHDLLDFALSEEHERLRHDLGLSVEMRA